MPRLTQCQYVPELFYEAEQLLRWILLGEESHRDLGDGVNLCSMRRRLTQEPQR